MLMYRIHHYQLQNRVNKYNQPQYPGTLIIVIKCYGSRLTVSSRGRG